MTGIVGSQQDLSLISTFYFAFVPVQFTVPTVKRGCCTYLGIMDPLSLPLVDNQPVASNSGGVTRPAHGPILSSSAYLIFATSVSPASPTPLPPQKHPLLSLWKLKAPLILSKIKPQVGSYSSCEEVDERKCDNAHTHTNKRTHKHTKLNNK